MTDCKPDTPVPQWLAQLRAEVERRVAAQHSTQAALAAHLGITPKHINQILRGKVNGSPELLDRIAAAVGLRIAVVIGDSEPVPLAGDKRPWASGNWKPRAKPAPEPEPLS